MGRADRRANVWLTQELAEARAARPGKAGQTAASQQVNPSWSRIKDQAIGGADSRGTAGEVVRTDLPTPEPDMCCSASVSSTSGYKQIY